MVYTADFETNNSLTECRVWSWGLCSVENPDIYLDGTAIKSFIETCKQLSYQEPTTIWFHNLKFDGSFILSYLFNAGYSWTEERFKQPPNTVTTLISDEGVWYSMNVRFVSQDNSGMVTFNDSLKILPFKVAQVAKSFGLPESKGSIDYDAIRPIGYTPTPEEREYQRTDCHIMAVAINRMLSEGMDRITAGSNALHWYKANTPQKQFEKWFPELDCDEFIRKSYRGGWVYAAKQYRGKVQGEGIVLDVNSLYPSRMQYELLPYGMPTYYTGKYKQDKSHPLYVQKLQCSFELKKNHLPTIQIKGASRFLDSEYLESSNGEIVELTLTNVDLQLLLDHYDVRHLHYMEGYKFKAQRGMFKDYIDYWIGEKVDAEKRGDMAMRTLSKLYLNSLYGKFAKRPTGASKIPYLDESGILKFRIGEEEDQGKLYIPIGTFITAYARNYTIRSAQKEYKRFMYADTDSLHLSGTHEPEYLDIDKYKLGAWKHESTFKQAVYIGAKAYIEEEIHTDAEIDKYLADNPENETLVNREAGTILKVTCAGMPDTLHRNVTMGNFKVGLLLPGKLRPKQVPGGVILEKTTFEIKERK